ncbi:MFS transporter [Mangrovibacterium lignilyticum]|uniref:MFS transporter n=1 Tax=Mangrovibacterium lignilyticum TaxID=2668052 RepID=UPI0013D6B1CB|nr:MFS transporter [Mangrovibacterium lignilyticum]
MNFTRKIARLLLLNRHYFPVAQLFLSLSLMFGTWIVYLPSITEKLGMDEGQLGVALLSAAIGSLISTWIGNKLSKKIGEGKLALLGVLGMTLFIFSYFLATSFLQLSLLMFLFGLTSGIMQIGLNTVVTTIEQRDNIAIMSSCHAWFSLGGMLSAGFGTVLMIMLNNPLLHIGIAAAIVLLMQLLSYPKFLSLNQSIELEREMKTAPRIKNPRLWALAVVAVTAMVSEGAIADWSGLYLRDVTMAPAAQLGLGYAGFSMMMTLGRFCGDYFSTRLGPWQILLNGFLVSLIGLLFVFTGSTWAALSGFALVGAGFSILVPEAYRLSTKIAGVSPSSGIAFMAGAGYIGFLGGPVLIGTIANHADLRAGFLFVLFLILIGLVAAFILKLRHINSPWLNVILLRIKKSV